MRRYALPGPDLAPPAAAQACATRELGFGSNGVLLDGIGPP